MPYRTSSLLLPSPGDCDPTPMVLDVRTEREEATASSCGLFETVSPRSGARTNANYQQCGMLGAESGWSQENILEVGEENFEPTLLSCSVPTSLSA